MRSLRLLCNFSSGKAAIRVLSGEAGKERGRVAGAVVTWLAVLAILVQTIVPDFAMAARNADRQKADIAVAASA